MTILKRAEHPLLPHTATNSSLQERVQGPPLQIISTTSQWGGLHAPANGNNRCRCRSPHHPHLVMEILKKNVGGVRIHATLPTVYSTLSRAQGPPYTASATSCRHADSLMMMCRRPRPPPLVGPEASVRPLVPVQLWSRD
jgi:hypothetical protein